jgi:hypothetical protein
MLQAWEKFSAITPENIAKVNRRGPKVWGSKAAEGHEIWLSSKTRYAHIEAGSDEADAIITAAVARAAQTEAAEAAIDAATGRLDWEF